MSGKNGGGTSTEMATLCGSAAAVRPEEVFASSDSSVQSGIIERMFDLKGYPGYHNGALEDYLQAPNIASNADEAAAVCQAVNGRRSACATRWFVGRLVPVGSVGLIDHNGKIEAVPDGRFIVGLHRATWLGSFSMTFKDPVRQGPLTIVRVPRGKIGLAYQNGNAILLDAGLHVHNDVLFTLEKLVDLNSNDLNHGPLHVVRVTRGNYAKAWLMGPTGAVEPKLLREGCHIVDSNLFKLDGHKPIASDHISHGALNIMQVQKGHVAKIFRDNVPKLLGEGTHYVDSTNFIYKGVDSLSNNLIKHGTITIVRVNQGEVGLAWQDNQPVFMEEPGLYNFDSPTFNFVRLANADEKMIDLGPKKIVTVYSGEVGLSYDGGELHVLAPGRHIIEKASHTVKSFLSTQQKSVRLVSQDHQCPSQSAASAKEKDMKIKPITGDWLVCETKDLVKVGIRADVFYAIEDPDKAIRKIAVDEIELFVLETSLATITNIIRSTTLNEIAQSKLPSAVSSADHEESMRKAQAIGDSSAPLFFDKAHDEFLSKLHDDFKQRYGIEISNIRIESFKIMDQELANNISKQALTTAQTESELANLAGRTEIATKEQERLASVRQISAQAEASSLRTKTEAENQALLSAAEAQAKAEQVRLETAAKAEASATIEKAKAEAEAIRLRGNAEAEALACKAEAEAKRARMLAETPLGAQLSLLGIYAEMAAKSNEGIQKVVYSDLQQNNLGLLGIPSLAGLSRDLQQLQTFDSPMSTTGSPTPNADKIKK
mmetsp:Transcript_1180/g.2641  ORF Transcript_1180/g.2641 Transcript_1180/m.2641 type:complete len:772 (-) Transcript_1180:60-2375(-)|eukprot:CAMPEP_0206468728 /NCGR_PEP_ID=MMETSP0324_2-20121206/29822_1 /ASSEMBLY_ACC=CAM_ASM_000836 /TAXON_ID=2866 /ORGANISM="Crypthecodinium cohnii, Strain Seligo" /LENGTH=771 /DNA_ID=CAMNT_0053942281 /DNA_START=79 /DNA_END=2394 /DNA_ORIENTATION=+